MKGLSFDLIQIKIKNSFVLCPFLHAFCVNFNPGGLQDFCFSLLYVRSVGDKGRLPALGLVISISLYC